MRKILRGHLFIKKFLFTLSVGLFFFGDSQAQVSGTFTINSAAATSGTNFHSFTDAVTYMQSGLSGNIVFNVVAGSGPYNEQIILGTAIGATSAKTVTFNGNGATITFTSTNTNQRAVITLNGADYITFDNVTVVPVASTSSQYGYGFHLLNDADNNTIKNCKITNTVNTANPENNEGIVINGNSGRAGNTGASNCDNNLIQNNTISGGNTGISLNAQASGNITNNSLVKNAISGAYMAGIWVAYSEGTVIDGNNITGNNYTNGFVSGLYLSGENLSAKVINNYIHQFHEAASNGGSTIYAINIPCIGAAGKENLIANNLIYDLVSTGFETGFASEQSSAYFNIYNNTVILNNKSGGSAVDLAVYMLGDVNSFNIINNIFYVTAETQSVNYGYFFANPVIATTIDYNNFYMPQGTYNLIIVGNNGGPQGNTLAEWKTDVGFDLHSIELNPQFVDEAAFNFLPLAQQLDNRGTPLGSVTSDIVNTSRNATFPDMGCYEFLSTPCSAPITAGNLQVDNSAICIGSNLKWGIEYGTNSAGSGQTYTWQTATSSAGPFTNESSSLVFPSYNATPTTRGITYHRVAVTCGASTAYTNVVKLIVTGALSAGTYTLNSSQPSSNTNFQTYNEVIGNLACGITGNVVVNVTPGKHVEQVIIRNVTTTANATVRFNCNGDTLSYTTINTGTERALLKLDHSDYITFDSLVMVADGPTYAIGVQLINDADHNTISNSRIYVNKTVASGSNYWGIVINGDEGNPLFPDGLGNNCDSNLFYRNTITGGNYGITLNAPTVGIGGTSNSQGNKVVGNTIKDFLTYGVYLFGVGNTLIDSNDISTPTRTTFSGAVAGIYGGHPNTNINLYGLKITRNRIHDLLAVPKNSSGAIQTDGIFIESSIGGTAAVPTEINNNLIYNIYGAGQQYGIRAYNSAYTNVHNNTISLEDTAATASVDTRGIGLFSLNTSATNLNLSAKNNNIVIRRTGASTKIGLEIGFEDATTTTAYNYNNYLITSRNGTNYIGSLAGAQYATLAGWWATKKDSASFTVDPLFSDPLSGDYSPGYLPFDNKGTPLSNVKDDILGVARSTTKPDIGAYEFTICYPITAPALKVDQLDVYSIRFSWTPVQYASGYLVSRDGGISWVKPTSGNLGTTHTISGLKPLDTVSLLVKVLGTRWDCPVEYSNSVKGQTMTDQIFIPNTFTPNGNSYNDVFKVYTNIVKSLHLMVYNQWGEKVFETNDINGTWDGTYKGKKQPVGVYVYVATMVLTTDGSTQVKKGTFNLIR